MAEASRQLNLAKSTINLRVKSPKFPNSIWLKEQGNKKIPNIPEIQEKVTHFFSPLNKT